MVQSQEGKIAFLGQNRPRTEGGDMDGPVSIEISIYGNLRSSLRCEFSTTSRLDIEQSRRKGCNDSCKTRSPRGVS